jgi:hypothetical protein
MATETPFPSTRKPQPIRHYAFLGDTPGIM